MARVLECGIDLVWTVAAATLIAAAALMTVVRLLLPEISTQRAAFEEWISTTVGRAAVIGEINASWRGWSPRFEFAGIAFLDPSGVAELVRFDRAAINIAPLGSIFARTLKPKSLVLSGVELTLIRHEDGHFAVAGMPAPKSPVILWLLKQHNFAVTQADLTVIDNQAGASFSLSNVTVTIRNRDGRKHLSGFVDLPASIGQRLAFELTASNSPLESDWDGEVNVRIDGVKSSYLTEHLAWHGEPPPDARLNIVAWTQWQDGRLGTAQFRLEATTPNPHAAINHGPSLFSASGGLYRRAQGWRLDVHDMDIPGLPAASSNGGFSAAWRSRDGVLQALVFTGKDLPLTPFAALLTGIANIDGETRTTIVKASPSANLRTVTAAWRPDAGAAFFVDAQVSRLSTNNTNAFPGLARLDAHVTLNPSGGLVRFDHTDFKLDHDRYLIQPIDVSGLTGALRWVATADGHAQLTLDQVRGSFEDAQMVWDGELSLSDGTLYAALTADITGGDAAKLQRLLPMGVLPAKGERWSRALFKQGRLKGGRIALRGALNSFPFDHAEGVFKADFDIAEAVVQYASKWPQAEDFDAAIRVRGREVRVDVARGLIAQADVAGAEIVVRDMLTKQRLVRISGTANAPATAATYIVMHSPLKSTRAARLQSVDIGGDIEVDLDMSIALYPGGAKELLGQVHFDRNRVHGQRTNITLENVVGTVSFTRSDWYGEGLTAEFGGSAVGLVLNGSLNDPNYDSELRMTGTSEADVLLEYLGKYAPPLYAWLESNDRTKALTGALPWKAVLTIPRESDEGAAAPRRLTIESSLLGLDVDLPWPFGKRSGERKPLRIETHILDQVSTTALVDFGDTMDVEISSHRDADDSTIVDRVEVIFGSIDPQFKGTAGVTLSGYIPRLPLNDWAAFLEDAHTSERGRMNELPVNFDVQVRWLQMLGQEFEAVRLRGANSASGWHIHVDSLSAAGNIFVPHELNTGLVFDMQRLHLAALNDDEREGPLRLDPRRIPSLRLQCKSFTFKNIDFGHAEIVTEQTENGLTLESLAFENEDFSIVASGKWLIDNGHTHRSRFDISVDSAALEPLLNRFGYGAATIDQGATNIGIRARWPGTPMEFTLDKLTGTFDLHVEDGRLLDIEPGGGRLFGLLSLQTLPRRLSFDFNDLFKKGFAFDRIDGIFELEYGNAYTNSLMMDGPSARIDVSGRTGLAEQDYDQHVVVTPALSNSIPIASALFGPIGVGAGAVYYIGQKLFKSIPEQVDKFLSREYSITGSWENPVIDRI